MRRGRPTHALGGTPRKDHLWPSDGLVSLCRSWFYGGGRELDSGEPLADLREDDDLCRECLRVAVGLEDADG